PRRPGARGRQAAALHRPLGLRLRAGAFGACRVDHRRARPRRPRPGPVSRRGPRAAMRDAMTDPAAPTSGTVDGTVSVRRAGREDAGELAAFARRTFTDTYA